MRTNASFKQLFLVCAVKLWVFRCWSCLCLTKLSLLLSAVLPPWMAPLASHRLCLFLSGADGSQKACCPGWACAWNGRVRLTASTHPRFYPEPLLLHRAWDLPCSHHERDSHPEWGWDLNKHSLSVFILLSWIPTSHICRFQMLNVLEVPEGTSCSFQTWSRSWVPECVPEASAPADRQTDGQTAPGGMQGLWGHVVPTYTVTLFNHMHAHTNSRVF